jgi:hypothetical protein
MTGDLTLENSAFICVHVLDGSRKPEDNDISGTYMCTPCWDEKDKDENSVINNVRAVHKSCANDILGT